MSAEPHGQLTWRCRRGMKELDLVLKGWLEQRYPLASADEKALFARFLELPDPVIAGFLFGHAIPADPAMGALIAQLSPRSP